MTTDAPPRLLLIDDDPVAARLMRAVLAGESVQVDAEETAAAGLAAIARDPPRLVVLDMRLPDADGLAVLEQIGARHPGLPVIVLTGRVEVASAVRAMQLGAVHYLTKPINHAEVALVVRRALERRALEHEVEALRQKSSPAASLAEQMGPGRAVQQLIEQVRQVAATELTVLVLGETGTGKELVAQAIHRQSPRAAQPLIAIDCGAIPEALLESELFGHEKGAFTGATQKKPGQFQLADGGTLFLDEAANLPAPLQPKLLRVLESRELQPVGSTRRAHVDVRIVAATNMQLQGQVRGGAFREDLFFRLAQFTIRVPPLRERPEDLPHLVKRFAAAFCLELKRPVAEITPGALAALASHAWPGNVRELRNVVRQAVLRCQDLVIDAPLLAPLLGADSGGPAPGAESAPGGSLREIGERAQAQAERAAICSALRAADGNKSSAARALQTDYKTLHVKLKRYAIGPDDYC